MNVYGLTGGIATGKSTVSEMFKKKGLSVIDADVVARTIVARGQPAFDEIAERFPEVVTRDSSGAPMLDRAALGARIFKNPGDRAALNAITHPRVRQAVIEELHALEQEGAKVVLYDVPLLIENGLHEGMNGVILVTAPLEAQRQRLMARNAFTEQQANERIAAQLPLEQKRKFATWVIDNGGTLAGTQAQVEEVWQQLLEDAAKP